MGRRVGPRPLRRVELESHRGGVRPDFLDHFDDLFRGDAQAVGPEAHGALVGDVDRPTGFKAAGLGLAPSLTFLLHGPRLLWLQKRSACKQRSARPGPRNSEMIRTA